MISQYKNTIKWRIKNYADIWNDHNNNILKKTNNKTKWLKIFEIVTKNSLIVINFYSPSCFDQERAKEPFGLLVKLPLAPVPNAQCPPFYYTRWRLQAVLLWCWTSRREAVTSWTPTFIVFSLTRPRIEPEPTVSVANAVSTRALIGSMFHRISPHWCNFKRLRMLCSFSGSSRVFAKHKTKNRPIKH